MIYREVLRNKLHHELIVGGIDTSGMLVQSIDDSEFGADITFTEGTDMELVQSIIDAHDPTPLPKPLSEIQQLKLEQAQANAELVELIFGMTGGGL